MTSETRARKERNKWVSHILQQEELDLSISEYCQQNNISHKLFVAWRERTKNDSALFRGRFEMRKNKRRLKRIGIIERKKTMKLDDWRELIDEQIDSNLSITEFCQQKNINANSFYGYRSKFGLSKKQTTNKRNTRKKRCDYMPMEQWVDLFEKQTLSGLNQKDFCIKNNIKCKSWYSAKNRLKNKSNNIPPKNNNINVGGITKTDLGFKPPVEIKKNTSKKSIPIAEILLFTAIFLYLFLLIWLTVTDYV